MTTARVFYGWWVALAFAAMVFISTGVRFAVGPFLKPMVADLDLDRAGFSLAVAIGLFLYGGFMPLVGWLTDRLGARAVVVAGTLVLAGAAGGTGLITRGWQLYLVFSVVMALGLAATGHVVASAVVARWFTRRRATALTLLGAASMAGISLLVPAVMALILTLGWRLTWGVIGLAVLAVMLPLALGVVRESPESMGLRPDGAPGAAWVEEPAAERTGPGTAVRSRTFWQLAGALGTCGFTMSLLSAHGVPMLTDHGYRPMLASWALGVLGASSVVFALLMGALGDRIGCRPVLVWIYGGRALMLLGLFAVRDNPLALLLVAALGGATMSGTLGLTSALTATLFGPHSVGPVFGLMFLVHQTGAALGSGLGGVLFELTGGYGAAFGTGSAVLVAASLVSLGLDEQPRARLRAALEPAGDATGPAAGLSALEPAGRRG